MNKEPVYNPLDKSNLGASVAEALLKKSLVPLGDLALFHGAGIYAIYYHGDFEAYKYIRSVIGKHEVPIYVGKAVPAGARKGGMGLDHATGTSLNKRLKDHAKSIAAVENLRLEDFTCRYLVVDDIWIPLGEALMISKFSPIWNKLIDGFGNHDTGKERYTGLRPRWDTIHPGRTWALKCRERPESREQIIREILDHLKARR